MKKVFLRVVSPEKILLLLFFFIITLVNMVDACVLLGDTL